MNTQNVKVAARNLRKFGLPADLVQRLHNLGPHIHPRRLREVVKLKTFIKKK